MFDNAWLYNKRITRIYKYCTKVKTNFNYTDNLLPESMIIYNYVKTKCGHLLTIEVHKAVTVLKSACTLPLVMNAILGCLMSLFTMIYRQFQS